MHKTSTQKTPHAFMRGFALLSALAIFACSCGISPGGKTVTWGQKRYGLTYDSSVFTAVSASENELSLSNTEAGNDFGITAYAFVTKLDTKAGRDKYYESALQEFQSGFEKILNEFPEKLELKGITTYTDAITGLVTGKQETWKGWMKLIVMDDAVVIVTAKGEARKIKNIEGNINDLLESAYLKGSND